MKLHRNGTNWNRDERNKTNDNWDKIEGNYNNVVENVSEKAFDKVVDSAKLNWKEPVANVASLPTNDENGTVRQVRDTGKVYRFNGTDWIEVQDYDATAINEVDSRLSAQLADTDEKLMQNKNEFNHQIANINAIKANTSYVDGLVGGLGANSTFKGKDTNANILALVDMAIGDEWFDTNNSTYLRYNGSKWIDVGSDSKFGDNSVGTKIIQDESVTLNKVDFVKNVGKNIFNPHNYILDKIIDANNGMVRDSVGYLYSVYIPVLPSTTYHRTLSTIVFYDNNKKFISGTSRASGKFTTPTNAVYIIVVIKKEELNTTQIELGTVGTYYEPYRITVRDLRVSTDELANDVKNVVTDFPAIKESIKSMTIFSKNLFNHSKITKGKMLSGGSLATNATYSVSDFITVKENTNYKGNRTLTIAFYDKSKDYIPLSQVTVLDTDHFTSPSDAVYMRISMPTNSIRTTQVEEGVESTPYEEYFKPYIPSPNQKVTHLTGKNILFIGDSNTHLNKFPEIIGDRTGAITYNGGAGGTRLTDFSKINTTNNYAKFNGCAIADAIVTGDWSTLDVATSEIDSAENQNKIPKYASQLQNIKKACEDMNNLHAIVLQYGTNDANNDISNFKLGEPNSLDTGEWNGAINYFIKQINTTFPHVKIYFCSPIFRELMPGSVDKNSDEWAKGVLMPDMVEAMRDRLKENHLPFKDLYNESGINKYTSPYYLKDKTHYSIAGDSLIASKIEGFILTQ